MNDHKLIASVVVFKELHDNDKDIYDIIAEFMKNAIVLKKQWLFNSTEATNMLKEAYDFSIPEAVIKTTLRKRLKRAGFLNFEDGVYSVLDPQSLIVEDFERTFNRRMEDYNEIFEELSKYIEYQYEQKIEEKEREELFSNFNAFLLGHTMTGRFTNDISSFVIKIKREYREKLTAIKEGLVLYTGVRYTANLNDLGIWHTDLTIFLDTDMLFYMSGYSGIVFKDIFSDFYKLIIEINTNAKRKSGSKKIQLRYFEETENDINNFFYAACAIVEGKVPLNPSRTAMQSITSGCQTKSDILVKKNKLFLEMKQRGILREESRNYYLNHAYNLEDSFSIESIRERYKEMQRDFEEEKCMKFLRLFTKLNVLRKGSNSVGFERCGYLLLTGSKLAHLLTSHEGIKQNDSNFPFALDIDNVTDKLWFKLKKGFGDPSSIPRTFDVVTKAQIVLSAQINNTVQEKYTALTEKYNAGEITKEEAISLSYELRESAIKPEEIIPETVENSLAFINEFSIEEHIREKARLELKAKEGENAIKKLNQIKRDKRRGEKRVTKRRIRAWFLLFQFAFIAASLGILFLLFLFLKFIVSPNDTAIGIIGFIIALLTLIRIQWIYRKLNGAVTTKLIKMYKEHISDTNNSQNIL